WSATSAMPPVWVSWPARMRSGTSSFVTAWAGTGKALSRSRRLRATGRREGPMAGDSDGVLPANMRGVARHLANHEECEPTGSAHRLLVRGADEIDRLRARVAELEAELDERL